MKILFHLYNLSFILYNFGTMLLNRGKMLARQVLVRAMHARAATRNRKGKRPGEIKRILVIRPDHLGDLLFATPALALIRQSFPEAHITGAVAPWGRAMWEDNPDLDTLVTIPFPGIAGHKQGGPLAPYRMLGEVAKKLARERYDLGIALRFDHWWGAALMWVAGIPQRWGYDTPGMGAWLAGKVAYVSGRHEVEQNVRLVEGVLRRVGAGHSPPLQVHRNQGKPSLRSPSPTPPPNAEELLGEWQEARHRVVIHPGTGAANKLWTIAGWAEVVNNLRAQGWQVALTGSPGERKLVDAIASACNSVGAWRAMPLQGDLLNLVEKTASLGELTWVLSQAHLVLGVDSGPLHIAASLGKPTLHLYGPSDETIWGPWGDPDKHRVLRAPGTRPTMRLEVGSHALEGGPEMQAITPELVMAEVEGLMRDA
ncbi:MAG TPA: glycosyltransferase family 9 protein [Chloroflexia bacterium]|nr:glycosyltransferase family 9 protein [Chloroflexia bacterium]